MMSDCMLCSMYGGGMLTFADNISNFFDGNAAEGS